MTYIKKIKHLINLSVILIAIIVIALNMGACANAKTNLAKFQDAKVSSATAENEAPSSSVNTHAAGDEGAVNAFF